MTYNINSSLAVVAIGSSAGGLKALQLFVASLSANANVSYIVAQHLSPKHESAMVALLAEHSSLEVVSAEDEMVILANTIYVCPENSNIEVVDDQIRLSPPKPSQVAIPNINFLLASVAVYYGKKSVGMILSGVGSDGAQGMKLIKSNGGVTIVHDPDHAQYNGMPNAAISATIIDHVLRPDEVHSVLTQWSSHEHRQ